MCHGRENNRKINWLHKRCLRTMYNDKRLSFNEFFLRRWFCLNPRAKSPILATGMYKISNGQPILLMKDVFPINRNPDTLKQNSQFSKPRINTVYHGTESTLNLGPKILDLVPSNLNEIYDLDKLKKSVKQWKPEDCPCKLFKVFCQMLVFWKK